MQQLCGWRAAKKNGSAGRRVTDALELEEQKCLQMKQNNRLIEGFKPDALPSLLVQKE